MPPSTLLLHPASLSAHPHTQSRGPEMHSPHMAKQSLAPQRLSIHEEKQSRHPPIESSTPAKGFPDSADHSRNSQPPFKAAAAFAGGRLRHQSAGRREMLQQAPSSLSGERIEQGGRLQVGHKVISHPRNYCASLSNSSRSTPISLRQAAAREAGGRSSFATCAFQTPKRVASMPATALMQPFQGGSLASPPRGSARPSRNPWLSYATPSAFGRRAKRCR